MITSAPTLETERLVLRAWRKEDFRPWLAIMREPEVNRFLGSMVPTEEDMWRRLTGAVGSWPMVGFGGWAVTLKTDGRLVGNVGLFIAWRALEPEFGEDPEMGWIFAPETHGKGFASEATRTVLEWADTMLPPSPIWAIVSPENHPSIALAGRLGFARVRDSIYNDEAVSVFRRPPRS